MINFINWITDNIRDIFNFIPHIILAIYYNNRSNVVSSLIDSDDVFMTTFVAFCFALFLDHVLLRKIILKDVSDDIAKSVSAVLVTWAIFFAVVEVSIFIHNL